MLILTSLIIGVTVLLMAINISWVSNKEKPGILLLASGFLTIIGIYSSEYLLRKITGDILFSEMLMVVFIVVWGIGVLYYLLSVRWREKILGSSKEP